MNAEPLRGARFVCRLVAAAGGRAGRVGPASLLALVLIVATSAVALGQSWLAGGGLALSVPQGEFGDRVDEGFGVGGHLVYLVDPYGVLGLRLDAAIVTYGRERFEVPLSRTVSRVRVDVTTRNNILLAGFGPQLSLPLGAVRPYVNGSVGLGYFFTESSVGDDSGFFFDEFARTTNFDDLSFAYGVGGGLGIALRRGPNPLLLALDLQYRDHGETRYLREGSIEEDGFGGVFIHPLRSDAEVLVLQLGVSVGF